MNTNCEDEQEYDHRIETLIAVGEALYVPADHPEATLPRLIEQACATCVVSTLLGLVARLEKEQEREGRSAYLIGMRIRDHVLKALVDDEEAGVGSLVSENGTR